MKYFNPIGVIFLLLIAVGLTMTLSHSQTGSRMAGKSVAIGGGLLLAGGCSTGTVSVPGAQIGMRADAAPTDGTDVFTLGGTVNAVVTSTDTVTVSVCAIISLTPPSKTYNVVVTP